MTECYDLRMAKTPASQTTINTALLSDLPKSQVDRLTFIDFKLFFLGEIRRIDLQDRFETGAAGATRDLAMYKEVAPENMDFDGSNKVYRPSKAFRPVFEHSAQRALTSLSQGFGEVDVDRREPLVRCDFPMPLSVPKVEVLAAVSRAIYRGVALRVAYTSNTSGASEREIVPFAFVDNGLRWHVRAYDRKSNMFKDFMLSRMAKTELLEDSPARAEETPEHDIQWSRLIELELMVHPKVKRPELIAQDYNIQDGVRRMRVRATNAGYLLRLWNVDCSPDRSATGGEVFLCLKDPLVLHAAESAMLAPGYVDSRPKN
jgi:hypothetical protein